MKHKIIVTLAAVAALAVPAQASAATSVAQVTATVKKQYTQQIAARTKAAGFKFIGTTMKCAVAGQNKWTCNATYTVKIKTTYAEYGQRITVTATGWKAIGKGTLLKHW